MTKKINERGAPSLGGLPGDSFGHNTVPRPSFPSTGAQSKSADSQVAMGRINKRPPSITGNADEQYADRDMFPDNVCDLDDEEEDDYDMGLRSKLSLDLRGRKVMPEVRTLSYILDADIDDLIKENEKRQELIDEDLIDDDDADEVEEHSIGGYTGPMAPPANPKKFYKGMLKSYPGSHYVNDLPKSKA
jgi:hypothetical protein